MKYIFVIAIVFFTSCNTEKDTCLKEKDIPKVKAKVLSIQKSFKKKDYDNVKEYIDSTKIADYTFSRITSLLNESLVAKEVIYTFQPEDENCGSIVVDFLSFEIITDDEGEHRIESSVSLEFKLIDGELKIVALGFAG